MTIIEINYNNITHLNDFIDNDLSSSFRYFKNRTIECINNHILTIVYISENKSVGYAHIDKEDDRYWFGICILDEYQGKGIGKQLIEYILNNVKTIPKISLTVDKDNIKAIKLYTQYGFKIIDEKETYYYMENDDNCSKNLLISV